MAIKLNSRHIKQGDVFVALNGGKTSGVHFINNAIKNGATKIITEKTIDDIAGIEIEVNKNLKNELSHLAQHHYPNATKQKIIAITGTNGKTSVASFISQIMDSFGVKNQVIGTLTGDLTTPDIFSLYEQLHNFDGEYSILEVSSHALVQRRVAGLEFELAIWTNLSQDHLDYHKTMQEYREAKLKICNQAKFGIFNADDEFYPQFAHKLEHNSFSLADTETEVKEFGFLCNIDNIIFEVGLIGEFNLYNILASYQAMLKLGCDKLEIIKAISELKNPLGRMQKVDNHNIWIDFSHTPDGLKNALKTIKSHYPDNTLTVVFGCGGNRDSDKRAKMGKIADTLADRIILTSDNPRDENPENIIKDIQNGIQKEVQIIVDRKLAISAAVDNLRDDECVLIAGKGVENYQIIAGEKIPFNDFEIVKNLLP